MGTYYPHFVSSSVKSIQFVRWPGGGRHNAIFIFCCGQTEVRIRSAHGSLYEILRKSEAYFKLCCGQNRIRIRSARGSYMKYSANQRRISSFVVGKTGSEYGLPVAVIGTQDVKNKNHKGVTRALPPGDHWNICHIGPHFCLDDH